VNGADGPVVIGTIGLASVHAQVVIHPGSGLMWISSPNDAPMAPEQAETLASLLRSGARQLRRRLRGQEPHSRG
jgi:hypothetical protein